MKRFLVFPALLVLGLYAYAQNPPAPPKTWPEKAAERLKPVTDEQKAKILAALPAKATAMPKKERKILVFWRCEGFIHTSIPCGNFMLQELGKKTGAFSVDLADEYSVFSAENLAQYDLVLFNNTTGLQFKEETQKKALMDFVAAGKGIAGIHAASDNFGSWPEASHMIGGIFNGHPWGAGGTWAYKLDDAKHPLNASFQQKGFWHQDEIYQYKPETFAGTDNLRILVSLDMSKPETRKPLLEPKNNVPSTVTEDEAKKREVAVSWLREFNGGRVFYSNLGHREETNWQPAIVQHYLDGIQYALGDLAADATPTAKMSDLVISVAPDKP